MNLVQVAPLWLVVLLCAALVAAAVEDILRMRISNATVFGVVTGAGVAAALYGFSFAFWENLLVFAILLAGGTMLFATGKVGGGDAKLLAAVGLWMDLEQAVFLLAAVFISGGVLALIMLTPRLILKQSNRAARDRTKGVPYAVAIAMGTLFVVVQIQTN